MEGNQVRCYRCKTTSLARFSSSAIKLGEPTGKRGGGNCNQLCKVCRAEYQREYREKNRDAVNEDARIRNNARYHRLLDEMRAKNRARYHANSEAILARNKLSYHVRRMRANPGPYHVELRQRRPFKLTASRAPGCNRWWERGSDFKPEATKKGKEAA